MAKRGGAGGGTPRERGDEPNAEQRGVFLDALAATCCVRGAMAAAGADPGRFYALKRRDAAFASAWTEALGVGYDAMEAKLIAYVMDAAADEPCANQPGDPDAEGTRQGWRGAGAATDRAPVWVQVGLSLISRHRAQARGEDAAVKTRTATPEETDALLNAKLDQLARSLQRRAGAAA